MLLSGPVRRILCITVVLCGPAAHAEALRPSVARRLEENTTAITAELREVIASTPTVQGEQLQGLVAGDSSHWGIRYRDGHLLFSIPVRKNLSLREKNDGELEARKLALVTLGQKFNRLLDLEDASQGLDPDAVRVIFIEPDALRAFGQVSASRAFGGFGTAGSSGWQACIGDSPCLPAPPSCGCE